MEWLTYLIKVQLVIAAFYLIYILCIHKKIKAIQQRAYLLMIIPLSFLVGYLKLPSSLVGQAFNITNYTEVLPEVIISSFYQSNNTPQISNYLSFQNILVFIYLSGLVLVTIVVVIKLLKLNTYIKDANKESYKGKEIRVLENEISPASLFNSILISKKTITELKGSREYEYILEHEYTHCSKKHFLDLIYLNVLKTMLWFNPIVWLIFNKLKEVHEYEVDSTLINSGVNLKEYAQLLLNMHTGFPLPICGNHFSYLSIKNRIFMMNKNIQKRSWRLAAALPLIISVLGFNTLFAENTLTLANESITPDKAITETNPAPIVPIEEIPFSVVEVKPTFQGGDQNTFTQWVATQIKYPKVAQDAKVQGRVTLQFTVTEEGKVTNVKALRGVSPELDAEAVRVLSSSPDWTPGMHKGKKVQVRFTFPVIFQLNFQNDKK